MLRIVLAAILLLETAGCGSAPRCATLDAKGIADANHSSGQLKILLEGVVQRTVTASMVIERDGSAGSKAIARAINAAVDQYQSQWDRNIVASWNTLTSGEIEQACAAIRGRDETA